MRIALISLILTLNLSGSVKLMATSYSYEFCVNSSNMETFQAVVIFRSLNFGPVAARELLANQLRPYLAEDFIITPYSDSCSCFDRCPVLEVIPGAKNTGSSEGGEEKSLIGGAAENLDSWFYEAGEVIANPGGTLKKLMQGIRKWLDD